LFTKVFGQIFDSSIAEDYNCRRMFMDLLVLADPTGAVDMTEDAIARRTNVPVEEVRRYIKELCQPDTKSRSPLEEGKRLVPLDPRRDWGWLIVNYVHYRKVRDEEARRSYFRDSQRRYRRKRKEKNQKKSTEEVEEESQTLSKDVKGVKPALKTCPLLDSKWLEQLASDPTYFGIDVERELGKMRNWCKVKNVGATRRRFVNWLNRIERPLSAKVLPGKTDPSAIDVPGRFKAWVAERYPTKREEAMNWKTWADVSSHGLREEWWKEQQRHLV
jgi:hypothetical protein